MRYRFYSKLNQSLFEGTFIGISLYLAYHVRYDRQVPAYQMLQFWICLAPILLGRMLTNWAFGINRIQWRHLSLRDVISICKPYVAFSLVLVPLNFGIAAALHVSRIPSGVIALELLFSLSGALAIRALRRLLFEHSLSKEEGRNKVAARRLLLIGAGIMGANTAKEMAANPAIEVVGFLDDDPHKRGCVIAGAPVLGTTSQLTEIVSREKIDGVLLCISPNLRGSFNRLLAVLDGLPVTSKFVPTITEILDAKDGLHLGIRHPAQPQNGSGARVISPEATLPKRRGEIRNKCVLITGGGGFIGSALAERLAKENQVLLLDRFFHDQPYSFTALSTNRNVKTFECDILEGAAVDDLARQADIVIHAAAIVGVGRVCTYPRETLETNFAGTSRILRALEKNSRLERFVYFSTSEVFGVNSFRVNEHSPSAVGPAAEARWSYAIAKLAGEHLVKAYHRQVGTPVVTVRPFNVFGPRRLGAHAILRFVLDSLRDNPIEVHGDGSQIRSWCYIEDFCDAIYEMLVRPEAVGEDFNIGNPINTLTVLQLAQQVIEVTGRRVPINLVPAPFPDIEIRVPSLEKARLVLGYQPSYDLRRGLQLTVDWYVKHMDFFEARLPRDVAVSQSA
jgi:nucleoside-diphosphate-sugar epimerase